MGKKTDYDNLLFRYQTELSIIEEGGEDNWSDAEFTGFSIEWCGNSKILGDIAAGIKNSELSSTQCEKYNELKKKTDDLRPLLKKLDLEDPFDSLPADAQ